MDRRQFLVGTSAATAATVTGLPALAARPPEQLSPLFGSSVDTMKRVFYLEPPLQPVELTPFDIAKFYSGKGYDSASYTLRERRMRIVDTRVSAESLRYFATIEQSESWLLEQFPCYSSFDPALEDWVACNPSAIFCGDGHVSLPTLINRASNLVAQRTRRAASSTVLTSPGLIKYLNSYYSPANPLPQPTAATVGQWTRYTDWIRYRDAVPLTVYTSTHIPDDAVYVIYNGGSDDAPAGLARSGRQFVVADRQKSDVYHGITADFGVCIRIERKRVA